MALRRSIGATRNRLVRQLLVESLVLCVLALLAGVVLARWALVFLTQLVPPDMFLFAQPALDGRTLAVTSLVALTTGILFGLAPALHMTKIDPGAALKYGGRGVPVPNAGRRVLVVAEVAMTLILLVVAGLLIQTLYRLRYADLGFQPAQVMSLRTALSSDAYPTYQKRMAYYDHVIERVSRLPGVVAVGYSTSVPLAWKGATTELLIEGHTPEPGSRDEANFRQVSAAYLQTLGVPLLEGRHFADSDRADAQPVVIINQAMARTYWPGGNAIGRRLKTTDGAGSPWLTVVGVVGDVRQMGLDLPPRPEMYVPYRQFDSQPWFAPRDLVVRATDDPTRVVSAVVREIHAVDPTLPVTNIRLLDDLLDKEVASRRVGTLVLVAFAAFAVVLAIVGIYGLISYFVAQHAPEIGLRVALGAQPRDILTLVAGRGVVSTAIGVVMGAVGALAASRVVSSLLYGVSALDPTTLLLASVVLLAVAMVASYVPARRATKLDAMVALRQQ
jgi:putative ABC transport system permease protein